MGKIKTKERSRRNYSATRNRQRSIKLSKIGSTLVVILQSPVTFSRLMTNYLRKQVLWEKLLVLT